MPFINQNFPISRIVILCLIGSFILSLNWNCSGQKEGSFVEPYASLNDTVKYVGMNTCRECHADIYDSFINTGMGKSFDNASYHKSSADFTSHEPVYDPYLDLYYLPYWDKDSLRILEFRLGQGDTIHKRTETITYIVGSGQHTNSHIINTNGYLTQAPLTFYTQKRKWDLPPGFENGGNTRFNRLIGLECMTCHNSFPEFIKGSENKYDFVDHGISCERCHGPGEVHVNNIRSGKVVDISTEIDYSIVNPAKLPIDRQFDICQRCHIQGNAVLNEGRSFFDFRPGMKLSDVMNVFMPVFKGSENEHIMASHAERLKMSTCYLESRPGHEQDNSSLYPYKNSLTCITCHDPHVSVSHTGVSFYNDKCTGCHSKTQNKTICTEDQGVLKQSDYNCISCHMPRSGATDIPHVTVHDHMIRVPVDEETVEAVREFVGITCINNPDVEAIIRGKAFIAYFEKFNFQSYALDSALMYISDATPEKVRTNFHDLVHIAYLREDMEKITDYCAIIGNPAKNLTSRSYDNKDAWTAYRIAEAYSRQGDVQSAGKYFRIAYGLAPSYPDFAGKYGNSLAASGKLAEAAEIFRASLNEYPKHAPNWNNLGFTELLRTGDTTFAAVCYNKCLALDPDNFQALLNKAALQALMGQKHKARSTAHRAKAIRPDDEEIKRLLYHLENM
jgi:hypothetical protein